MMMPVKMAAIAAALLLGACATPVDAPEELLPFPVSAQEGVLMVESEAPCDLQQDHDVRTAPDIDGIRAVRLKTCVPKFPAVLLERGFAAACVSKFDLTDEGAPINVVAMCNTINVDTRFGGERRAIADAMFVRAMERVIGEMRYEAVSAERPNVKRAGVIQGIKFSYQDTEHLLKYPSFEDAGS